MYIFVSKCLVTEGLCGDSIGNLEIITIYAPMIYTVFWAPNGTTLSARCHFTGPKKLEKSRAQTPPTSPRNGYARIQNIMHGAV
jgi:hypothetical protein